MFVQIYGSTTICQIKDGKHTYQVLEAHFVLYLALNKLYITKFIEKNQIIERDLKESIVDALTEVQDLKESILDALTEMQDYHVSTNVSFVQNHQKT